MGQTFEAPAQPGGPPGQMLLFVVPRSQWRMLDDWGDTLGLRGSGSHSIQIDVMTNAASEAAGTMPNTRSMPRWRTRGLRF